MKEDLIEMVGTVVDKQPNAFFKVQLKDSEHMVLATISGRMRRNRIRILMGDRVDIDAKRELLAGTHCVVIPRKREQADADSQHQANDANDHRLRANGSEE